VLQKDAIAAKSFNILVISLNVLIILIIMS